MFFAGKQLNAVFFLYVTKEAVVRKVCKRKIMSSKPCGKGNTGRNGELTVCRPLY